jgi:hypothetical protein
MHCDLATHFGPLSQTLPTRTDEPRPILLDANTLPAPRLHLTSDQIMIDKRFHEYWPSFRVDALWFHADSATYRQLGLLLLAVVFAAAPNRIHLELTHPASDIKHLLIDYPYRGHDPDEGFVTRQYGFTYVPALPAAYPWIDLPQGDPDEFPRFLLTNRDAGAITDAAWQARDTVLGFGLEAASTRLAELFLNIGLPHNPVHEYVLLGEGGQRGVGLHSAEARFFVPGRWGDPAN